MKTCINCDCELTDSNWDSCQQANWINKCSDCIRKEKREYAREWNKKNPGKSSERSAKHKNKLKLEDPIKARARSAYSDCRKRALKNGMEFDLTAGYVLELMRNTLKCSYSGVLLTHIQGGKENTLASIDRINSSEGYTQDNVQIISYLANLMKSSATEDELVAFAEGVLRLGALRTAEKFKGVAR